MLTISHASVLLTNGFQKASIGDFGLAKRMQESLCSSITGTLFYLAPELVDNQLYDCRVDVWALGVVLMQLIIPKSQLQKYGVFGLLSKEDPDMLHRAINCVFDKGFPIEFARNLVELLQGMFQIDPLQRLSAQELLNAKLFKGMTLDSSKPADKLPVSHRPTRPMSASFSGNATLSLSPRVMESSMESVRGICGGVSHFRVLACKPAFSIAPL
jgi:serine/threonine protein kinase